MTCTLVWLGACAPGDDVRMAWLQNTLVTDNQDLLERDPELVAAKFAIMAQTPFALLRGTAPQFARDLLEPGAPLRLPFLPRSPDDVVLVGDAHPENIGTFRDVGGQLLVDFNDFDAATYGPFEFDVRRLALGFAVACNQTRAALSSGAGERLLSREACEAVTRSVIRGYVDEIGEIATVGAVEHRLDASSSRGAIVDKLFDEAQRRGTSDRPLDDGSTVVDGGRELLVGDLKRRVIVTFGGLSVEVFEDTRTELDPVERARIDALLQSYKDTIPATQSQQLDPGALGVVRRFGAGVASYPLARWIVLLDGPTDSPDDDVLLEMKELRDPVALPGLRQPVLVPFSSNGARVVGLQRASQTSPWNDVWLGWVDDGGQSFRVREATGYQRGFDVGDLAEHFDDGSWSVEDFVTFAELSGSLLARTHARVPRANGGSPASGIAAAIRSDSTFVAQVSAFATSYAQLVEADRRRLVSLLDEYGPTLGYDRW